MLYLFYGPNKDDSREEVRAFLDGIAKKSPKANIERVYEEDFSEEKLDESVLSRGLFGELRIIVMEGVLGNDNLASIVLKKIGGIASSENIFIFLEGSLPPETVEALEENAEDIFYFKNKSSDKGTEEFNIFSLTDAFGRRDRKAAWILYQKAILAGVAPEEIHRMLFWQVKNIALVKKWGAGGAPGLGMKPFVFNKAKSFAGNFSEKEIMELSSEFVDIYHKSRQGTISFDETLEKLVLGL